MDLPFPHDAHRDDPDHRVWLKRQANRLFDLFERSVDPAGGFLEFDRMGQPIANARAQRFLHATARMVHCFALGSLLGRPGADLIVDHGMRSLLDRHRDRKNGGYVWSVDRHGPVDATKQGYGHAFVLLAASSARAAGHPDADKMIAEVTQLLDTRFWEKRHGAITEEFSADWTPVPGYRGQNSNMHLTEALMAAFEATGDTAYLDRAQAIADLLIRRLAGENGFRVPEHFDESWRVDRSYRGHEMFRPAGTTPGHWLEWSRLVLQLWVLGGRKHDWMPQAAESLFANAVRLGWDKDHGGFFYTLDWNDEPLKRNKLWWPLCEGIGAAATLAMVRPGGGSDIWYERMWTVASASFIDRVHGGWHEELTPDMIPDDGLFKGKGDIYHALQACLIPLLPATGGLISAIRTTPTGIGAFTP